MTILNKVFIWYQDISRFNNIGINFITIIYYSFLYIYTYICKKKTYYLERRNYILFLKNIFTYLHVQVLLSQLRYRDKLVHNLFDI